MPEIQGETLAESVVVKEGLLSQEDADALSKLSPSTIPTLTSQLSFSKDRLDLIASESMTSPLAIAAKYLAENGMDEAVAAQVEALAEARVKAAFDPEETQDLDVDLRSPSGAVVNQQVWEMLSRGARVRALVPDLKSGFGHLSHGGGEDHFNLEAIEGVRDELIATMEGAGLTVPGEATPAEIAEILTVYQAKDPSGFEDFSVKLTQLAASSGKTALGRIRRAGNPNVAHKLHDISPYRANEKGFLDFAALADSIRTAEPAFDVVILGGSANPNDIDYQTVIAAARERGTLVWTDAAHFAGLSVGGVMRNPVLEGADIVTGTTHKSLQGVKGAYRVANRTQLAANSSPAAQRVLAALDDKDFEQKLDVATVAAHAATFKEVTEPEHKALAEQIRKNADALAARFQELGWKVLGGGSESHIVLLNARGSFPLGKLPHPPTELPAILKQPLLDRKPVTGRDIADLCTMAGLVVNRNGVPGDQGTPMRPDGLRLGTVSLTKRGATEADMREIATWIDTMAREFINPKDDKGRPLPEWVGSQMPSQFLPEIKAIHEGRAALAKRLSFATPTAGELVAQLAEKDPELHTLLQSAGTGRIEQLVRAVTLLAQHAFQGKYAEGRIPGEGGRYYEGCEGANAIEEQADGGAYALMNVGYTKEEPNKRGMTVDCQAPNPQVALSSIAHSILTPGDKVLVGQGVALLQGMKDRYKVLEASSDQLVDLIDKERPRMLVVSTKSNPSVFALSAIAQRVGTVLVVDNSGDLSRVLSHEIVNPLRYADVMITDTSDCGGPNRGAIVHADTSSITKRVEGRATLNPGQTRFAVFPGNLGGPDLVTMAAQDVALRLAMNTRKPKAVAQTEAEEPLHEGVHIDPRNGAPVRTPLKSTHEGEETEFAYHGT